MSRNKILHILAPDKFSVPFIKFINNEFDPNRHLFLCSIKPEDKLLTSYSNVKYLYSPYRKHLIKNASIFGNCIHEASKIILHGNPTLFYFILFPGAVKKIFWMIMGYELGDSSIPEENIKSNSFQSLIKKFVLKRIHGHISHIKGDSKLANIQLKSDAKFYYSPMYLSNVVNEYKPDKIKSASRPAVKKILVGNSTCPTNDHASIFKMLLQYKQEDILIYCPLSYGDYPGYKNEVIQMGLQLFGNKFIPVTNFMKPDEYNRFLEEIDMAIFNHKRQEAMGVTLALLNMGKVVYMNSQTTSFKSLNERGINVFDNRLVKKEGLFIERDTSANPAIVYKEYSYERLKNSLKTIFDS